MNAAGNNNNNNDDQDNSKEPPKLPAGLQEGYDPFSDPTGAALLPSQPPPPLNPMSPKESKDSGSNEPKAPLKAVCPGVPPLQFSNEFKTPINARSPSPAGFRGTAVVKPSPLVDADDEKAVPIILEEGLGEKDYFHGLLPREDIEAMLRRNGDFVLRVTELRENQKKATRELCLSVYWKGNVHHFLLRSNGSKKFMICNPGPGEVLQEFDTVLEMVSFYQKKMIPFSAHRVVLVTPILRQEWELRHESITCKIKLGSGAFGDVYSGELRRKDKKTVKVAVKMLKGDKVDKKKILEIMNEARVMRPLKHKNCVRCWGVAADIEPLMIVMELINGGALDVYLKCHTNKVSLHQRISMSYDAALGLEYVHSKGVLHRDIAARNCLYDTKVLKVSDFGLSVVSDKYQLDPSQKAPVRWLSPEVFKTHIYTRAADVWAYGVLVWEIFNDAQEPYKGWTGMQIRDAVLQSGSQLHLPDWSGPFMSKVIKEVFEPNHLVRPSMSDVAKKIEKFAPKREDQEEESQDDSKRKTAAPKKSVAVIPKMPFKFFDKPKELPKSDDSNKELPPLKTSKSKMTKFKLIVPGQSTLAPPPTSKFVKKGSNEGGKTLQKCPPKEPFPVKVKNTSKDMTLSKEKPKIKKSPVRPSGSLKVRKQTREEKEDSSSLTHKKKSNEKPVHGKTKEAIKRRRVSFGDGEKLPTPKTKVTLGESRVKLPSIARPKKKKASKEKEKKKDNSSSGEPDSNENRGGGSLEPVSKSKLPLAPYRKPKAKER